MFKDLRDFASALEKTGQLKRVQKSVSLELEITEIHKKSLLSGGPAILFENVFDSRKKHSTPVLVNLFGNIQRIEFALGVEKGNLSMVGELLAFLKSPTPPKSGMELFKMFPLVKNIVSARPKYINSPECQEIYTKNEDDVNLDSIPIQTCWPNEPAPLITWPMVITKGSNDVFNVGIYRLQKTGRNTLIARWLKHRGGARHFAEWKKTKGNAHFPVAIAIGADPYTILAAVTPTPDNISEFYFAGILRNGPTKLAACKTVPLMVPANSEIVLEGYIDPNKLVPEGPYGDHTGYYNSVELFPEIKITSITSRKNPIYLSTYTGRPPDEPSVLGEALNEIFLPIIKTQFPEIVDFYMPPEACSYRIAVVSIRKVYAGHAKKIMCGIWSFLNQFLYTKIVIVVDDSINTKDWKDVMWAISTKTDPKRDFCFMENTPIDYLDFASPLSGLGSKLGIDATDKIYPETDRQWGEVIQSCEKTKKFVEDNWDKYFI